MRRYPLPPSNPSDRLGFPADYASFSQRILASALDSLVCLAIVWPFLMAVEHFFHISESFTLPPELSAAYLDAQNGMKPLTFREARPYLGDMLAAQGKLLLLQSLVLVPAVMWAWMNFDTSPGKWALRLRIVDAKTGESPSTKQYALRLLGDIPSALFLGLGFVWILFNARGRAWHDIISGTAVLRIRNSAWVENIDRQ